MSFTTLVHDEVATANVNVTNLPCQPRGAYEEIVFQSIHCLPELVPANLDEHNLDRAFAFVHTWSQELDFFAKYMSCQPRGAYEEIVFQSIHRLPELEPANLKEHNLYHAFAFGHTSRRSWSSSPSTPTACPSCTVRPCSRSRSSCTMFLWAMAERASAIDMYC